MRFSLTVQSRVALAFIFMFVLVLAASATGFLFSNAANRTVQANQSGANMVERRNDLRLNWLVINSQMDNLLIARQTSILTSPLHNQVLLFQSKLSTLQLEQFGNNETTSAANKKLVAQLLASSQSLSRRINELETLAESSSWEEAARLRNSEIAPLSAQFNDALSELSRNIQAELEQAAQDSYNAQNLARTNWILTTIAAFAIGILLIVLTNRTIVRPIYTLNAQVQRVTQRDFSPITPLNQRDEIGTLSRSIALLTDWLRESYENLERNVAERTRDLERRTVQIQVAAEIARDVITYTNLDELLREAVDLIRGRFGFYHAGVFLVDDHSQFALLKAASGEAGRKMLAADYRLKIAETSIVGYVCSTAKSRIALDVGADAIHFKNPYLPDTRSEMAIPLQVAGRVIGALDVQSQHASAFTHDDVTVLQIIADQLAVAIENANLIRGYQENLQELEAVYGHISRKSWEDIRAHSNIIGYEFSQSGIQPIRREQTQLLNDSATLKKLEVPLRVRNQEIGILEVWIEEEQVNPETLKVIDNLSERLSQAIESARLYQETQYSAQRERLTGEITARIRQSLDLETVMQTAVREIGEKLKAANVEMHLAPTDLEMKTEVQPS